MTKKVTIIYLLCLLPVLSVTTERAFAGVYNTGTKIYSGFEISGNAKGIWRGQNNDAALVITVDTDDLQQLCINSSSGTTNVVSPGAAGVSLSAEVSPSDRVEVEPGIFEWSVTLALPAATVDNCLNTSAWEEVADSEAATGWTTTYLSTDSTGKVLDKKEEYCTVTPNDSGANEFEVNGVDYNDGSIGGFPFGSTVHEQGHTCATICHNVREKTEPKNLPKCE